jgi:hypothetical protein
LSLQQRAQKPLFCIAVNLLELPALRAAISRFQAREQLDAMPLRKKSAYAAGGLSGNRRRKRTEIDA